MIDAIAIIEFSGFGKNYPVKLIGDFVKNNGTDTGEDTGFSLDIFLGRASKKNDVRFRYGYAKIETDAVLAAFSNDNLTLPTNYRLHTFTVDYVILEKTTLNLTWYLHKKDQLEPGVASDDNPLISRLRLNLAVSL